MRVMFISCLSNSLEERGGLGTHSILIQLGEVRCTTWVSDYGLTSRCSNPCPIHSLNLQYCINTLMTSKFISCMLKRLRCVRPVKTSTPPTPTPPFRLLYYTQVFQPFASKQFQRRLAAIVLVRFHSASAHVRTQLCDSLSVVIIAFAVSLSMLSPSHSRPEKQTISYLV